jgi:hypothetical protein
MKLISFDIGMKNLAYVVLDNKKILYWNIINLIKEPEHCYISTCKKEVIKSCIYNNKTINMCLKHISFYDNLNETKSELSSVKYINCLNVDIDDLKTAIVTKLDEQVLPLIVSENIENVALENQPSLKNPRMKAIADSIYMWFLIRCKVDKNIVKTINYISPSNKLKKYMDEINENSDKEKYAATKNKAIMVVTEYLKNTEENNWLNFFDSFKKQDDLADCLLQGFYYLDNKIELENKEKKKKEKKEKKEKKKKEKNNKVNINNIVDNTHFN